MSIYEIRVTQLEEFVNCKYYFRFKPKQAINQEALDLGTNMHKSLGSYLHNGRNYKIQEILKKQYDEETIRFTDACIRLADKHQLPGLLAVELPYTVEFKIGEDIVIVKGTIDGIVDEDYLIDIKSASTPWKEDVLQYKLQRRIYPVLFALSRKQTEGIIKFDYRIFTKQKTPQFQQIGINVNISEHIPELQRYVESYLLAEKNGRFEPNPSSSLCFFCQLGKDGLCPAKNKNANIF